MRRPSKRHLIVGAVLLASCVSAQVAELKQNLPGLRASSLRMCLGAPTDIYVETADSEVWTYHIPYIEHGREIDIQIAQGAGVPPHPPRVVSGKGLTEDESLKDPSTRGRRPGTIPRSTCLLFFRFEGSRVSEFDAAGRDAENLNADERCALLARHCAPGNE